MSNANHDEVTTWDDGQDGDHPAGEMALSRKSKTGARARALAGLTLAVGAYVVVAAGLADSTSVSAPVTY
ncbi:hypothetical protein ABZ816_22335 [Actinosynnema sp. NPDC047251]|uniref:Putative membrane protein n=1 Tax=Saccharothrix espanaensis (strain ATCC 51144 / DSM 44229 / JCM 9112 / NBRC 15066 / NRRL 15764) TaxID=1179773 RepID=K0K0A0_SACES|nr:hypothetical protein [Saccharothrix espanaensis]CCH33660.1 putative membrane protein [Saccharothrix espanaensis DSM 44229]